MRSGSEEKVNEQDALSSEDDLTGQILYERVTDRSLVDGTGGIMVGQLSGGYMVR